MWCALSLSFLAVWTWLQLGARVAATIPAKTWSGWPRYVVCGGQFLDSNLLTRLTRTARDTGNVEGQVRFWTTLIEIPVPELQEKAVLTVYLSFFEEAEMLVWDRALYKLENDDKSVIGPAHVGQLFKF